MPKKESNSAKSKRIAKNTIVLYFRMLFLMLISLYTTRVIVDALGVEDYGIYNVVGGFVAMFGLMSAALTSASSRFLNYEMGRGNIERQIVVFSTTVGIQWTLAIIVFVLAEAVGFWYINNVMVLPTERLLAANWCFQFSILNFCINIITVPYNASIIAHEKMKVFAYVGILQGLGVLAVSFLIYVSPIDELVFYAFLLMFIQFLVCSVYKSYCKRNFKDCQYRKVIDRPLITQMMSYSVWHLLGNGASVLKNHGVNIVLNLFFGPAVNAARGISSQIESAVSVFVGNFMMAVNPQITQSYAQNNLSYMFVLLEKGSRYSFYLLFFLSLPIILNADYILNIWLHKVPEYAVLFVQTSLVAIMINCISRPLITAQNATGNVRNYQLIVGGLQMLNLPLSYVALKIGMSPIAVVGIAIIVEVLCLLARIYVIPQTIKEFKPNVFLNNVAFHCLFLSLIALVFPILIKYFFYEHSMLLFIINILVCFISTLLTIWLYGCSKSEREIVRSRIAIVFNKIRG